MWIRSQDKSILVDSILFETLVNRNQENIISGFVSEFNGNIPLGTYSTKEKSLKVLDMIQSFINNELIRDYMVFQMPLDESL